MSRKLSLIVIFLLLVFMLACELSPPATSPPSATEADAAYPMASTGESYPAPATATDVPPLPTTATDIAATATGIAAAVTDVSPPTFTATTPPTITVQPSVTASLTPTATFTAIPYPYVVQEGCPVYMPNFAHPDAGCNWLGVAGQVFDAEHIGIENLVVIAGGTLAGAPIDIVQMTGSATAYGSGGYELVLSSTVVASEGTLWVQVKDLAGTPLTPKIYLDTHDDCFQNLLLLNFVQQ